MPLTLTRSGFARPGTSLAYPTGTWRVQKPVHQHSAAPCHAACPAGEDGQAYLAKVAEGRLQEAWETIVAINPLPAITGRVCHHPCETGCNRLHYDQPIAIHNVERFLGDEAIRNQWRYPVEVPPASAPVVAVVGAGPGGLSAAYHLLRRGYRVTLFDELPEAGGTLRTALPPYRLPRDILNAEVSRLLATGMKFEPQQRLGRDFYLEDLEQNFAAAFLAPGNQKSREWSVDGATPRDLHVGLDLLKEWISIGKVTGWRSAAIVGGGNTAVDLARALRRAGVAEVHVITHQALPGEASNADDQMSAIPREIDQAREEGVTFHPHRGIRRLILRGERVVGVEMVRMRKLANGHGTSNRVAFEGTETVLHVDQVIPAIGQEVEPFGVESLLQGRAFFQVDAWGHVPGHPGLFAGGDARGGRGTVSGAIGDGRRAAEAIDALIQRRTLPEPHPVQPLAVSRINLNYYERAPRAEESVLPVDARQGNAEIEGGLSANQVYSEAQRCFSCGNCFACDNCWTLCPDMAVLKTTELASDGSHYQFDYEYCKGCGLCANECPCSFIEMQEAL